jgi:hypothetical protein
MARARSCAGKVTVMIDRVPGIISEAPMPWRARKPMSSPVVSDSAHESEARVKTARPDMNMRLRPNRSPSVPPVSRRLAKART